jgi:Uncharacterized protein conserved in bacteria (DUF2312)
VIVVVERVERIDEEIKVLNEGKKEVFAEAKGEGFDGPYHSCGRWRRHAPPWSWPHATVERTSLGRAARGSPT